MTALSQEEIITNTKTVVQGLEALKNEHNSILSGLVSSLNAAKQEKLDSNLMEEKSGIVQKSLDMIELGLGEAQVRTLLKLLYCWWFYNVSDFK